MKAEAHRWRCACCGQEFVGLPMAMGFEGPTNWGSLDEAARALSSLGSDFCKIVRPGGGIERYIRALLMLPVPEIEAGFQFAVWVSVSERSWDVYNAGYGVGTYDAEGCFGYLSNSLPDFEIEGGLHANVWFQPGGMRPLVDLHDGDHPLIGAQKNGIPVSQIERWEATMHSG